MSTAAAKSENNFQLCRVISEAKYTARANRVNRTKPQPWVVRKLMVAITLGIIGYTGYVYMGRFCVGMIFRDGRGDGRRLHIEMGAAIAMLVIFCILYLWMLWAYARVVLTPPGFARDYIPQTPPPPISAQSPNSQNGFAASDLGENPNADANGHFHDHDHDSIGGPSYEDMRSSFSDAHARLPRFSNSYSHSHSHSIFERDRELGGEGESEAGVLNVIPRPNAAGIHLPAPVHLGHTRNTPNSQPPALRSQSSPFSPTDAKESKSISSRLRAKEAQRLARALEKAQKHNIKRRPPNVPVLLPEYRYCSRDEFVKPFRTHHCRICGTCVLKYDHHCPWIGQCVGARNHKFFINFNLSTSIFTAYTFATLIAFTVGSSSGDSSVDIQEIVIIALAALFFIFTSSLLVSHTRLLCLSQTTVESLQYRTMDEREDRMLTEAFGMCSIRTKRIVKRHWDAEWGRVGIEGNLWWAGSMIGGWEQTMGSRKRTRENPWGWGAWVLPVGIRVPVQNESKLEEGTMGSAKGGKDEVGLYYEPNPRFDKEGRWMPKSQWPQELR